MSTPAMTLDQAIEAAMQLPPEQREMLLAILHSRQIDERRQEIADGARASIELFRAGKLKPQPAEQVIEQLHQTAQEPK